MAAVRARLDPTTSNATSRRTTRRKLRLEAQGSTPSDSADVLILNISTTGLLLETTADLCLGETIELDLPEAAGTRAVIKWSSGQLFGCQFREPVTVATVSGALLRAPSRSVNLETIFSPETSDLNGHVEEANSEAKLPLPVRLRWIVGLMLLSWGLVAASAFLAWSYVP